MPTPTQQRLQGAQLGSGQGPSLGSDGLGEVGQAGGIDAVVLGLAAVDGLHVVGVADQEGELLLGAEVGEPVPGEHALDADHQAEIAGRAGLHARNRVLDHDGTEDEPGGIEAWLRQAVSKR